jgi:hypothetical protein
MAEVPYAGGVPQVMPETRAPDDYQHIQANPSQFGGLIGAGEEKAGQGLEQTAGNLFNIEQFKDKIDADSQVNNYITAHNNILYGDPSKPRTGADGQPVLGPDGKPVPDTGYMGLDGRAAADQRADTLKALEDQRTSIRANLKSPQAQLEYDAQTKRMYADAQQRIDVHTDQGWKQWAGNVNEAGAQHAMTSYLRNLGDGEMMKQHAADYINFKVQAAQIKTGDDPQVKQTVIEQAQRDLLKTRIEAVSVNDPSGATKILEAHRDIAGPLYEPLSNQLRARSEQQDGITAATQAVQNATAQSVVRPANARAVTPDDIHHAIVMQESGGNPNEATSTSGAVGIGQIMPATFRQYALPGESITNPATNLAVSKRIINDYFVRYGGDAQRVAVAYFSGPGNVAPPGSPTPWIADRPDPNGKTTSAYVSDVTQRISGQPAAPPGSRYANAVRMVMNDPNLSENAKQHGVAYLARQEQDARVAADATAKAQKEQNDQAANGYVTRMLKGDFNGLTNAIANDPALTWETKRALGEAAEKHGDDDVQGAAQSYGPGFWDAYKKITAPVGDPDRISDPLQVYQRAGPDGDLKLAGAAKLVSTMKEVQRSVDDQAVHTTKTGLMNYAKSQLSFEQDTGPIKIRDPKGEAIFNAQFIPKFEAAYEKWTKGEGGQGGKDPWQFLTKENVDKMLVGMRNKSEMAMERVAATGETLPPENPNLPPPPAPEGIDPAAWQSVVTKPPVMETGAPFPRSSWATALQMLAKNPTPENIATFDRSKFGRAGFRGEELLGQLQGKKATQAEPLYVPPEPPIGP